MRPWWRAVLSLSALGICAFFFLMMLLFPLSDVSLDAQTAKRALLQEDVGLVNVQQYGSAFTSTTIQAAITAIGSAKRVLFLTTGTWNLGTNVSMPANIRLWVPASSTVVINSGVTLTLYNDPIVDQPNWYSGGGTLTILANHGAVFARDYGMVCDNATPDDAALARAIAATPEGGRLVLPFGICKLLSQVSLTRSITLQGQGMADSDTSPGVYLGTVLSSTAAFGIGLGHATKLSSIHLRDFTILHVGGNTGVGIAAGSGTYGVTKCVWQNILIAGWSTALQMGASGGGFMSDSVAHGVFFRSNSVNMTWAAASTNNLFLNGTMFSTGMTFANLPLPVPQDSTMLWCRDCTRTNPCAGAGSGSWARAIAGAWICGA